MIASQNYPQGPLPKLNSASFGDILSLSILILNSRCLEGARDVRILLLNPIKFSVKIQKLICLHVVTRFRTQVRGTLVVASQRIIIFSK